MKKIVSYFLLFVLSSLLWSCADESDGIKILAWAGVPHDRISDALPVLKECGVDWYLAHCGTIDTALEHLDEGHKAGLMIVPGLPMMKDSTEKVVNALKAHPALLAYNVKDEPETWDISWLRRVNEDIRKLDPAHPAYINLYPDWAWGGGFL